MDRDEILEKLEEMWEESNRIYIGSGEAELDFRENVATWIFKLIEDNGGNRSEEV